MGGSGGKGGDTARSIGYQWTPEGMETLFIRSKVRIGFAGGSRPKFPVSGGWFDIRDLDCKRTYAHDLKLLGYTSGSVIHAYDVGIVNLAFNAVS